MSASHTVLRQLIRKHRLARVEIIVNLNGVTVKAMPDSHHPAIEQRRIEAYAKAGGSLDVNGANEIRQAAAREPVAISTGVELDTAILNLKRELQRL